MDKNTQWINIVPIKNASRILNLNEKTCLPCHHAYVAIGAVFTIQFKATSLAFGYAGYQSSWPEQTPYATTKLAEVLSEWGVQLVLPVYDIQSKYKVLSELSKFKLSSDSLEQKCLQQIFNEEIKGEVLRQEIDEWTRGIKKILANLDMAKFTIVRTLGWSEF